MIFYSIIFALSLGGVVAIVRKHEEEFHAFNFAQFMERLCAEIASLWQTHFRDWSFSFLEKRLRGARIWMLKIESMLFRTAHKLRGLKEKNGNNDTPNDKN